MSDLREAVEDAVRRERHQIAEALELAIHIEGGPAKLLAELRADNNTRVVRFDCGCWFEVDSKGNVATPTTRCARHGMVEATS